MHIALQQIDMIEFIPYDSSLKNLWDSFVDEARNSTFLFRRDYMDYHADRFADASTLAFSNGKLIAMLPANRVGNTLFSHQGLTYGGWIIPMRHFDYSLFPDLWDAWLADAAKQGIEGINYSPVPHIYHLLSAETDLYLLFRCNAVQNACGLSSTIDLNRFTGFNTQMRRQLRKAESTGLRVAETDRVEDFVAMLSECLMERHAATPVHSAAELRLLKSRFPDNIRIFAVAEGEKMLAGVCTYETPEVIHAQYIASTPEGRELHLLPLIFHHLIVERFRASSDASTRRPNLPRYFDFGISTERGGEILNAGLYRQKSSFGGQPTVYPRFFIPLR